jgi:DNA-binding NarL/FixJ family response regulator
MTDRHDDAARDLVRHAHHSDPEPADLDIRAGLADVLARGGQQAPLEVDVAIEVILDGLDGGTRSSLSRAELVSSGRSAPTTGTIIELQLTPQELRVALAVRRGLTNREAAAELFLSVKKIESHLSSIYRKIGINSRTQLIHVLNEGRTA